MKRIFSLFLILTMVLSLFSGCGSEKIEEPEESEEPEIQLLLEQGWVPDSIKQNLDETILWNEMLDMLANIISICDASVLENWNAVVRSNDDTMERDDGMLAIYEAACVLGIGHQRRNGSTDVSAYYDYHRSRSEGFDPNREVFSNVMEIAPYEPNPGWEPQWDYITSAMLYSMGQSSVANPEPFFDYVDSDTRFYDPLTRREAITAAAKLKLAYEAAHSGGYTIPETNWDDPLLAEAKATREAILNSPTTITKGEELILGETYTGSAYYVSNNGDDNNDGLSPETAWASLNKVEKAKLKYGDAVFFERGGTWYGSLKMQYGVTYSAYGEGSKPIITGFLQDAAQPEKWTLYAETADGGKIWKYAEEVQDAGVILLNGGEVVARKAYPLWNGKEYTNSDKEPYVVEKELADLSFFSALDLRGKYAKIGARLDESGITGTLYFRCDAGNPGEVYEQIELSVVNTGTTTADKGWNAIDNLHFRGFSVSGMDCTNHSNIAYQNCEADWCGGGIGYYQQSWYNPEDVMITISGGGLLLFGHDVTGRNNYIHDCENKGIAVVINGMDGNPAWLNRTNILAEGNVVERCGSSAYMMIEFVQPGSTWKFEDVRFIGNYFVNGSYGWRQNNLRDLLDTEVRTVKFNNVQATGEVLFENNLFYRGLGALVNLSGDDLQNGGVLPTLRGNTYVQNKNQLLFVKGDQMQGTYPETTIAITEQTEMETCVREYMGDATGKVIILE